MSNNAVHTEIVRGSLRIRESDVRLLASLGDWPGDCFIWDLTVSLRTPLCVTCAGSVGLGAKFCPACGDPGVLRGPRDPDPSLRVERRRLRVRHGCSARRGRPAAPRRGRRRLLLGERECLRDPFLEREGDRVRRALHSRAEDVSCVLANSSNASVTIPNATGSVPGAAVSTSIRTSTWRR